VRALEPAQRPYYSHPDVLVVPRRLFALLSMLPPLALALAGAAAFRDRRLLLLTPLVLALSSLYFWTSWSYLNVDIVATAFGSLAVAWALFRWADPSWGSKVVIPGILCGAAAASKYNSAMVVAAPALAIALGGCEKRSLKVLALSGTMVVAFLAFVPYSVMNADQFVRDVLFEIDHYRTGHAGFEGTPGLEQLQYYVGALVREYGIVASALALVGSAAALKLDWRKGMVLLSFPGLLLAYMSLQAVHFHRNVLPVYVFFSLLCSLGLVRAGDRLGSAAGRIFGGRREPLRGIALVLLAAGVLGSAPTNRIGAEYFRGPDSRKELVAWMNDAVDAPAVVLHPERLGIDLRGLSDRFDTQRFEMVREPPERWMQELAARDLYILIPHFGSFRAYPERMALAAEWNARLDVIRSSACTAPLAGFGHSVVLTHGGLPARHDPEISVVFLGDARAAPIPFPRCPVEPPGSSPVSGRARRGGTRTRARRSRARAGR
jgi:hypothetical protein